MTTRQVQLALEDVELRAQLRPLLAVQADLSLVPWSGGELAAADVVLVDVGAGTA